MDLRKEFKDFLEINDLKQAHVARSLGLSPAVISQWLKGEYRGDNESLEKKLSQFMSNFNIKRVEIQEEIVKTRDLVSAHFVMDEAIVGREMAVLYGNPGTGKSVAVKEWVKEHPEAILIEVIPGMRVKSLLKDIAKRLGIDANAKAEELVVLIAKEFKRRDGVLVIDEAEHLSIRALENIRRIWDFSRVPVILVGTYGLIKNLKGNRGELLQLYSRIKGKWEFKELDEEDFKKLFGEFASAIKRYTTHLRRAKSLYEKAKRFAHLKGESLSVKHIKAASSMIFLD
jgi:DNA transposition AAA+ family ATPase